MLGEGGRAPCSSAEPFSAEKKWGPRRKDFGGGYAFPGFYRVFVSTTGLESFSLKPEKFSKRFSFGGGCVRFFLLWGPVRNLQIGNSWELITGNLLIPIPILKFSDYLGK